MPNTQNKEITVIEITPIPLSLPLNMATVNCYLIKTDVGFVLIDTGSPDRHAVLERKLENARCLPGDLNLIVITHGDFDHIGNAVYIRDRFGAQIAMHRADAKMAERGDMFANRSNPNLLTRLLSPLIPILFGFGKSKRFTPDLLLKDGSDLSDYGLDAQVLSIPGHSRGSIAVLTSEGDLFCGDLFENTTGPALNSIMDDLVAAEGSAGKLRGLRIKTVYPGHGQPFPMEQLEQLEQANLQGAGK
jgi:glyoxylase-like metal-dependent hydrolase (beta-lactamase superfamily II)